jgi:hypothetical protein
MKISWSLLLIAILASFIFFTNLGGQDYSLDEPETISVAKSIFTYGFPSAWDGKNLTTVMNGKDYTVINNYYVWTWHPWLQHYITSFMIKFFGQQAGILRIPFAFFGVSCVILIYYLANYLYKSKLISSLISLHLIFLLPFFLYSRQIRYYSLTAFFSLAYFFLLIKLYKSQWTRTLTVIFIFVNLFLFMGSYLTWVSSLVPFLAIALWKKNKHVIFVCGIITLFALSWLYLLKPIGGNIFFYLSNLSAISIVKYLSYTNSYIFPLILLIPIVFIKKYRNYYYLFVFWAMIKILFYSFFQLPHGRYMIDLFPMLLLFYGMLYKFLIVKKYYFLLACIFSVTILTNLLNGFIPNLLIHQKNTFTFWPNAYAVELTEKYQSIMPQIGNYLAKNYQQGDLFWSNEYPLYIYAYSDVPRISKVCDTQNKLQGPPQVVDQEKIRWFIFFQNDDRLAQDLDDVPCFGKTWNEILRNKYHKKIFPIKEKTYLINDPDIVNRSFPPVLMHDGRVVIYEKNN